MDAWLTAIGNDNSGRTAQQKVLDDRPAGLSDGCFLSATDLVHEPLTDPSGGQCGALFPVASNPQLVAGEGMTMTALKCDLTPLRVEQLPGHLHRGREAGATRDVPDRVCDYSLPVASARARCRAGSATGDRPGPA